MIGTLKRLLRVKPPTFDSAMAEAGATVTDTGPGALAIVAHQNGDEAHIVIKNHKHTLAIPLDDEQIENLIVALQRLQDVRKG